MKNIVKLMKEQGNQFDWSSIVIDLSELPCFKPEAEWPVPSSSMQPDLAGFLSDGYVVVSYSVGKTAYNIIAKQTGDSPSVSPGTNGPVFTDCEPITTEFVAPLNAVPAIVIGAMDPTAFSYLPVFGVRGGNNIVVCGPMVVGGDLYVGRSEQMES